MFDRFESDDFEPYEKFKKTPKVTKAEKHPRKADTEIRTARRAREKDKLAAMEDIYSEE